MNYEMLRNKYKKHVAAAARLNRLEAKVNAGTLTGDRLAACKREIARLSAENKKDEDLFTRLEVTGDPAWAKLCRELDTALEEYGQEHTVIDVGPMFKKFIRTMSLLIVGTWMIDSWRKK